MSRLSIQSLGSFALITITGVACGDTGPTAERATQQGLSVCQTSRAVWLTPTPYVPTPCPDVPTASGTWRGKQLFGAGAPAPLAPYCYFEWDTLAAAPDWTSLVNSKPGAEPDCPVVTALAPPPASDAPAIWKPLRETFHTQASRAGSLNAAVAVRVAVLDSAARDYTSLTPDRAPHGRTVGRAIGDLACPGPGGCAIEIENHTALRRITPFETDDTDGGFFGLRSELASAVHQAVNRWRSDVASQQSNAQRLVINMSLGWDPVHGGDLPSLPLPARSVYEALRYARCSGALPIAAAGNYSAPGTYDAMFPGGWERAPAPDAKLCKKYVPTPPNPLPIHSPDDAALYRPLVFAAGALDHRDRPLSMSRDKGLPRLVAYGMSVVTDDPRGGHTAILTGSSMASATTSGTAAAAWAYAPNMTATQLMALVYGTGIALDSGPLGADAFPTLCFGTAPCSSHALRRTSVCKATQAAACIGPLGCGAGPECITPPPHAGSASSLPPDWSAVTEMYVYPPWLEGVPCGAACGDETLITPALEPSVGPQPGSPSCDVCGLYVADGILWVSMEEPLWHSTTSLIMTAWYGRTSERFVVPFPDGMSSYPQRFGVRVPIHAGITAAELDFVMIGEVPPVDNRVSIPIY